MYPSLDSISNASSSNASSTFVRGEYTEPIEPTELDMVRDGDFETHEPANANYEVRNQFRVGGNSFTNEGDGFSDRNNNFTNGESRNESISNFLVDSIIKQEVIFKLLNEMNFDDSVVQRVKAIQDQSELNSLYSTLSAIHKKITIGYKHLIVSICEVLDEFAKTFLQITINSTEVATQMMQNSIEKQTLLAKMEVVGMTIAEINMINSNQAANEDLIFTVQFLLNLVKSTLIANKS